jgi:hypothetical protein
VVEEKKAEPAPVATGGPARRFINTKKKQEKEPDSEGFKIVGSQQNHS